MWYFDSVHYERRDADLRQLSPNVKQMHTRAGDGNRYRNSVARGRKASLFITFDGITGGQRDGTGMEAG